jgi:Spy/CpxP family protein refolding chaperone
MIKNNELICPVNGKHGVRVSNRAGQYEVVERRQKMRKLLFIAVVVVGVSALVLAGRAGGFGRQGFANGPGRMHSGPGGFGRRGFAKGPEWGHPEPGGREHFGHPGGLRHDGAPQMMLGMLDLTDEQKEVIAKLVEDSREKLHADIEAVLTDEQIEKLQQLRGDSENRPFGGLDLTEEQQAAIAEIRENARADAEAAETRLARHEIMQATHDEILSVLTEEQVEKLEQRREGMPWGPGGPGKGHIGIGPRGPFEGPDGRPPIFEALDLTEEQQTAIAEIHEKARADVEAAETREARHEIMQAAHEEVWSVLTEEQIEKLEQLGPRAPRGRGRGRR